MADCSICCEKLNQSTRKEICCVYCDYSTCRTCFQKYISETFEDPHCMNCKKIFLRDFITDNCTSVFITKTLKSHRENVLLDRERGLLPETQPYVIIERERIKIKKQMKALEERRQEHVNQINLINYEINTLNNNFHRLSVNNTITPTGEGSSTEERKKFIRKCPIENCRGFLSQQWKCGSCDTKICNKCNEEKQEPHECLPENVASMELLNKDTKPCPECGTMIYRISGCNQMFCVDCHCAWNWNTGRVEKGVIHNPHYYDFIKRGGVPGRNHGDIPCGGLPGVYELRQCLLYLSGPYTTIYMQPLITFHNTVTHIQNYEMRNNIPDQNDTNRNLRVEYLLNSITEETFKKTLQQKEKQRLKRRDCHNIHQMLVDVASDIFRQIVVKYNQDRDNFKKFLDEQMVIINNLREYFNSTFEKLGKNYKSVYPGIDTSFFFHNNYQRALKNEN